MAVWKVEVTNAHYTLHFPDVFNAKFGVKDTKVSRNFPQKFIFQQMKEQKNRVTRMQPCAHA